MRSLGRSLSDPVVQATTSAERMFMRHLGAGCYLPVAAYGEVLAQELSLRDWSSVWMGGGRCA